jgi:hypothetical protein
MAPYSIITTLATEDDAQSLSLLTTASFSASDAAYPLIWGSAPEGMHDVACLKGLFTPVQKEGRVTYKAVDSTTGRIVGFATWVLPEPKIEGGEKKKEGLPDLPGVNMELWHETAEGLKWCYDRDVEVDKDLRICSPFDFPF